MAEALGPVLFDIALILVLAKAAGELFERIRQPAVLGELLAGLVVGPSLLGLVDLHVPEGATVPGSVEIINFIAAFGVMLLLFEVGLESNIRDLMNVGKSATWVALIGIAGSFLAGYAASLAFGKLGFWPDRTLLHIFVGATFTATSVGITARVLSDFGRLATSEARIILGAAVLDDVGGLIVLAIVTALAAGALSTLSILKLSAVAIGFLVVAVVVGLKVMPPVMDFVDKLKVRGVLLVVAVVFALLLGYVAEIVHLAGIIGAFAAGLILAQTNQHHRIFERVKPVADLFTPFFFVVMGIRLDLREVFAEGDPWRVLIAAGLLTVVAVVGKLICGFGVADRGVSRYVVGVGMVPRGEVGLIFAAAALSAGVIEGWEYAAILIVVAVSTFIVPFWLRSVFAKQPHPSREAEAAVGTRAE